MENRAKYFEIEILSTIYLIFIDMNLKSFGRNNKIWQIKIFDGLTHNITASCDSIHDSLLTPPDDQSPPYYIMHILVFL